jgi:hypothetical protein
VKKEYVKAFIPWKMLKKAIALRKVVSKGEDEIGESDIDAIAGYVIELFGQDLTLSMLDNGSDLGEMISIIQAVMGRASGLINPTVPPVK